MNENKEYEIKDILKDKKIGKILLSRALKEIFSL